LKLQQVLCLTSVTLTSTQSANLLPQIGTQYLAPKTNWLLIERLNELGLRHSALVSLRSVSVNSIKSLRHVYFGKVQNLHYTVTPLTLPKVRLTSWWQGAKLKQWVIHFCHFQGHICTHSQSSVSQHAYAFHLLLAPVTPRHIRHTLHMLHAD